MRDTPVVQTEPDGADLTECIAPLDEEGRRAVRRYWSGVLREAAQEAVSATGLTSAVLDGSAAERRLRRERARRLRAMWSSAVTGGGSAARGERGGGEAA